MGVVWRARDERLERVVAIKQLLPQPGLSEEQRQDARRRALREARIAARLHHPNAIVVFDVAEHDADPCLVMEYMAASSLSATLAGRGSLPASEVAAIGSQIASALAAAHASGIVHRDVKPGNILIDGEGVAKITDFGIAKAVGDVTVTQTGMFAGTPAYLAPEVARGQDPTSASDVFSFGATLYDAVEGGPPFPERQNQLALLRLVAEGKVQPPRQAGVLTSLLMKLLRTEADERPTMAEASRMLAELAAGRIPAAVPVSRPTPTLPGVTPLAETPVDGPPAPEPDPMADATTKAAAPIVPTTIERPVESSAPPLLSDRPAAYRPSGAPPAPPQGLFGDRKRLALIGAVLAVVVLVVVGLILVLKPSGSPQAGSGGTTQTSTVNRPAGGVPGGSSGTSSTSGGSATSTAPPAGLGSAPEEGQAQWQPAGQLLIDFYSGLTGSGANLPGMWAKLTPGAQAVYGSETAFQAYWAAYSSVSGSGAHGAEVGANPDGSVHMPIDVQYTGPTGSSSMHQLMRIVQEGGQLLIDADTRIH
jgi:eukaryotic-like serine/threonine-protein kinase